MPNLEPMDFPTVERLEVPVTIAGEKYLLREADGLVSSEWKSARAKAFKFQKGEMVGTEGLGKLQGILLAGCLFKLTEGGSTNKVAKVTILAWPDKMCSALYDRAMEISGLAESGDDLKTLREQRDKLDEQIKDMEETAKNSENSMEDGSD